MPKIAELQSLIVNIRQLAGQANIRLPCWLTGTSEWSLLTTCQLIQTHFKSSSYALISSRQWPGLQVCPVHQAHRLLGQEVELLIYDGFSGINPDALGQISGLLKGGGLLLLLTPPPDSSDFFDDSEKQRLLVEPYTIADVSNHFLEHLRQCFTEASSLVRFDQQRGLLSDLPIVSDLYSSISSALKDQHKVINNIRQHLQAPGQQCCVLTAARGRGKSSALGIIARHLMNEGKNMVVTASRADAVESLFQHAADGMEFERTRYRVVNANAQLIFQLPVDVCRGTNAVCHHADILLVDEAAGIPVNLLSKYLVYFPKIIFATTTQGYEGTGQGFALRFLSILKKQVKSLACYTLDKPVRWSEQDPMEPFFNRLLLLDAQAPTVTLARGKEEADSAAICYRIVESEWLITYPNKLRALFGLMIDAHYRTTPGDLRIMLDSPNLKIWIAESAGHIVGACLVAEEGGLDDELLQHIWQGRRRPRGHLIPQLLVAQEGYIDAAQLRALRVVRIAVHDRYRRQGVASGLLATVRELAQRENIDLVGASFAVTPELLDFWQNQGFKLIRIGTQLDPVSGSHAALVLQGLSVIAEQKLSVWQHEFRRRLIYQQGEWLKNLDSDILQRVQSLLVVARTQVLPRTEQEDWRDLSGFAFHFRSYESSAFLFADLAKRYRYLWDKESTTEQTRYLIEKRVIQQVSEKEVIAHCKLQTGKALLQSLRLAAAFLYKQALKSEVLV